MFFILWFSVYQQRIKDITMYIIYKQLVFLTDVLQKFNKNYYNNIVNKVQVAKNNLDQA